MTQATAPVASIHRSAAALGKKLVDVSAQTADYVSEYGGFLTFTWSPVPPETLRLWMLSAILAPRRLRLIKWPMRAPPTDGLCCPSCASALWRSPYLTKRLPCSFLVVRVPGRLASFHGLIYDTRYQTATYTVLTADVDADGVLQDLSGKTLASTTAATGVDFYAVYGP